MKFLDFVCFEAIVPHLKATDRDGVINELIIALEKAGQLNSTDAKKIAKTVIKRENEASTGMGKGIAVPHVKHPDIKKAIAVIGKSENGVGFAALDKKPVFNVILLLSPADDPDKHLQAMEYIFIHLQKEKFLKFLAQAQTAEAIKDLLLEADEDPDF
ncbi:MAG: PTS sugar transporter subunit IIA [Candidatus Brocadiia bacterium]|nr:MAG: PTS sugar transporter subunit IIA [Candidatus Brocadiia bacterium]